MTLQLWLRKIFSLKENPLSNVANLFSTLHVIDELRETEKELFDNHHHIFQSRSLSTPYEALFMIVNGVNVPFKMCL